MSRSKDEFLNHTGGFRFGETRKQFQERVAEIERSDAEFLNPKLSMAEREMIQRRLCELRGEYWDEEDE